MNAILKNAFVYRDGIIEKDDIYIINGVITNKTEAFFPDNGFVFDFSNKYILPGFADVHVHLREPGFSYKETIASGTRAAAAGGFTDIMSMPNLAPVPDTKDNLRFQLELINKNAAIRVHPYAAITVGERGETLSDMDELACAAAFSDDGRGVQSADIMRAAMLKAKQLDKIIAAHCEDNALLRGGYIHDGQYARAHGHRGICSESEWGQIKRDLLLVRETGCAYHVCHISTAESVALIRNAKKEGLNVTCETAPHYLVLCDEDLMEDGRFKMNPPLRSAADREALICGICDKTIDMIACDHAPHSAEEKSRGLEKSLMGVVGLETEFPVLYTQLVKKGIITLAQLVRLLCENPRKRFGLSGGNVKAGEKADFTVFDLEAEYTIDPDSFQTLGRSTPFSGKQVFGKCIMTVCDGNIVWRDMA